MEAFLLPRLHRRIASRTQALGPVLMLLSFLCTGGMSHAQTSATSSITGTPPPSVIAGLAYSFTPTVTVPEGQAYTLSVSNLPAWANFDVVTGRLYGTPKAADIGTYSGIRILLKSGQSLLSLPQFSIQVVPNRPPVIGGTPRTSATVGTAYSFRPTASDPDGQTLKFSIANKPAWASFAATTGRLYGTPGSTRVGTYSNIVISVSDGLHGVSLPPFSITVSPNTPPAIAGVPPGSATVGNAYSFRPTASDPDGQTLKFSIVNKPAWASFASRTGRLYGTPDSTRVGTYSNIVISVSDGQASASLPPFSITVGTLTYGSATVSWTPPTSHVDGTPLAGLAGYRIFYGTSPSNLSKSVKIPNPAITSATIEALPQGTWYFGVKAYKTTSIESDLSTVGYKTIN